MAGEAGSFRVAHAAKPKNALASGRGDAGLPVLAMQSVSRTTDAQAADDSVAHWCPDGAPSLRTHSRAGQ